MPKSSPCLLVRWLDGSATVCQALSCLVARWIDGCITGPTDDQVDSHVSGTTDSSLEPPAWSRNKQVSGKVRPAPGRQHTGGMGAATHYFLMITFICLEPQPPAWNHSDLLEATTACLEPRPHAWSCSQQVLRRCDSFQPALTHPGGPGPDIS